MLARLLVHSSGEVRERKILEILGQLHLKPTHPDVHLFKEQKKLGIEEAKKIRTEASLKPFQAPQKVIAIVFAELLTPEAQNALLKIIEEPPLTVLFLLGSNSEHSLIPTLVSRCQIEPIIEEVNNKLNWVKEAEKVLSLDLSGRFAYIEKLENKQELLSGLLSYYHQLLYKNPQNYLHLEKIFEAEKMSRQNVNLRALLEYLMLELPQRKN